MNLLEYMLSGLHQIGDKTKKCVFGWEGRAGQK